MLTRYDPFSDFDRISDRFFGDRGSRALWMPMNAVRREGHVEVTLDLPGVDKDSIDLTVERNVLTVSAERHFLTHDNDQMLARERPEGSFTRQVLLGDALDADGVEAGYADGVLTVKIPVAEQAKARKVEVAAGEPQRQAIDV
ncbi:MAG: Hsp20/alpha crystallin family protein [Acidimicrobiia bacterium]|nr:Hsp20/alpha crystallin family protein [Acidimicrobiia bacterium]